MNIQKAKIKISVIAILLLLILVITRYTSFEIDTQNDKEQKYFVILSTSVMPRYRFLLPITVIFWQKLGVEALVILVKDKNDNDSDIKNTVDFLKELNVFVKIIHANKLSAISLSQMIRLFGAVLPPFNTILSDNSILILSDADLAVFNLSNHIPKIGSGKNLHIHNIACCDPVKVPPMRGDYMVKMYAMSTIAATKNSWKEIMGVKKNIFTIDEIEDYIIAEFGNDFFHSSDEYRKIHATPVWFADQALIGYKIDEWLKNVTRKETFSYEMVPFSRRIDRSNWPTTVQFAQMKIEDYDDCHQPVAPFASGEWEKYIPFLKFAFKNDSLVLEQCSKYRKSFIE